MLICGSLLIAMSVGSVSADQWVNGYMKRDGTILGEDHFEFFLS